MFAEVMKFRIPRREIVLGYWGWGEGAPKRTHKCPHQRGRGRLDAGRGWQRGDGGRGRGGAAATAGGWGGGRPSEQTRHAAPAPLRAPRARMQPAATDARPLVAGTARGRFPLFEVPDLPLGGGSPRKLTRGQGGRQGCGLSRTRRWGSPGFRFVGRCLLQTRPWGVLTFVPCPLTPGSGRDLPGSSNALTGKGKGHLTGLSRVRPLNIPSFLAGTHSERCCVDITSSVLVDRGDFLRGAGRRPTPPHPGMRASNLGLPLTETACGWRPGDARVPCYSSRRRHAWVSSLKGRSGRKQLAGR